GLWASTSTKPPAASPRSIRARPHAGSPAPSSLTPCITSTPVRRSGSPITNPASPRAKCVWNRMRCSAAATASTSSDSTSTGRPDALSGSPASRVRSPDSADANPVTIRSPRTSPRGWRCSRAPRWPWSPRHGCRSTRIGPIRSDVVRCVSTAAMSSSSSAMPRRWPPRSSASAMPSRPSTRRSSSVTSKTGARRSVNPSNGWEAPVSSARERLTRLLRLVPYLDDHPVADLAETAALLAHSAAYCSIYSNTLFAALQLCFATGRPGHMPDDLIDASWEGGQIFISNAAEVSVPVRLSAEEAGILVLALALLSSLPGLDSEAVATAAQKLRLAAGENLRTAVDVSPIDADEELLTALNEAIDDEAALTIDYYVGSRDERTIRPIAPSRLAPGSAWYADSWCYPAGGQRRFAPGRIRSWQPANHPPLSVSESTSRSREVTLGLSAAGAWLADE